MAVTATGTLQGINTVEVAAEVSGRVTQALVDYNDHVEAGQLLAVIDPAQSHFVEAVLRSTFGGPVGIAIGLLGSWADARAFDLPFEVSPATVLAAFLFSGRVGGVRLSCRATSSAPETHRCASPRMMGMPGVLRRGPNMGHIRNTR